jgi:hypothetical protein
MRRDFFWLSFGLLLAIALPFNASRAIAHQQMNFGNIQATVHLDPNDSPYARVPSFTWFHLKRPDGETIPLSDCDCALTVYNSQNQLVLQPQLAELTVEGHEKPITTSITFPDSGAHRLVLTGRSRTNSFEPFQLSISIVVRP